MSRLNSCSTEIPPGVLVSARSLPICPGFFSHSFRQPWIVWKARSSEVAWSMPSRTVAWTIAEQNAKTGAGQVVEVRMSILSSGRSKHFPMEEKISMTSFRASGPTALSNEMAIAP